MKRSPLHRPASQRQQRGAAALIVTMVLFFAMTLVAAYVNRNLVFEQRISKNSTIVTIRAAAPRCWCWEAGRCRGLRFMLGNCR